MSDLRCPVCRAENKQTTTCRRCRVDLSLLATIEEQRATLLDVAHKALMNGNPEQATAAANHANGLRHGSDAQRLRTLGLLLSRDFSGALQAYKRLDRSTDS